MTTYPEDLRYTKDHEWIRVAGDIGTVGITDFAQKQLGDIVYVEAPRVGDKFSASEPFGSVESVKAVSELYTPVSGEITEINEALNDSPELLNDSPHADGWIIKIKMSNPSEVDSLLSAIEYEDYTKTEE